MGTSLPAPNHFCPSDTLSYASVSASFFTSVFIQPIAEMRLFQAAFLVLPFILKGLALPAAPADDVSEVYLGGDEDLETDGLPAHFEERDVWPEATEDLFERSLAEHGARQVSRPLTRTLFGGDQLPGRPGAEADFERARARLPQPTGGASLVGCRVNIDVYFKSWYHEPDPQNPQRLRSNGYIRTGDITAAMQRLNTNFFAAGFSFALKEHRRFFFRRKADWDAQVLSSSFDSSTVTSSRAYSLANGKRPLSGRPRNWQRNLHVYIVNNVDGAAAFANLPETATNVFNVIDGIYLDQYWFDGGIEPKMTTLTHEAGHWLGLEHTFEGGCANGDKVGDTLAVAVLVPSQTTNAVFVGCPATGTKLEDMVYSCPGNTLKPTRNQLLASRQNFMVYALDGCRNRFSAGQSKRMQDQSKVWRGYPSADCLA